MVDDWASTIELERVACPSFELHEQHAQQVLYIPPTFTSADNIEPLQSSRLAARQQAADEIENNRALLESGSEQKVPLAFDPLGTAEQVNLTKLVHGETSLQYQSIRSALKLDNQRLLSEAYRKNFWEYFEEVRQDYDSQTGDTISNNIYVGKTVYNGLTPNTQPEEEVYRVIDWVEEGGTYQKLGGLLLADSVELETVPEVVTSTRFSLCPQWVIDLHQAEPDRKEGYYGYVPEKKKFMIRNVRFDAADQARYESQMAVSGEYIDQQVIATALNFLDSSIDTDIDQQELSATQMVAEGDYSAWDWIKFLDALATEKHGVQIFMGELFEGESEDKDYQLAQQQSAERYAKLEQQAEELTDKTLSLQASGIDHQVAGRIIEEDVKRDMLSICEQAPERAVEMFDNKTADGFGEAQYLERIGLVTAAQSLRIEVGEQAQSASFCGAGSCGLENVSKSAIVKDQKLGNLIEGGDIVLKDTQRACPSCNKKGIVYAFNDKKVKKYCTECESVEVTDGRK